MDSLYDTIIVKEDGILVTGDAHYGRTESLPTRIEDYHKSVTASLYDVYVRMYLLLHPYSPERRVLVVLRQICICKVSSNAFSRP